MSDSCHTHTEPRFFDSFTRAHTSELGQTYVLVKQVSVTDPMELIVEGAPRSEVVAPLTSITCVEERADPSPTKSPATSLFADEVEHFVQPILQFSQKGKPGHFLRLSQSTYEQISHGKSVEFFNNYSIRHMVIRLRQSALPTQEAA